MINLDNSILIVCNWKMNGSKNKIYKFMKAIIEFLINKHINIKFIICPPVIYSYIVSKLINDFNKVSNDYSAVFLGAQNCFYGINKPITGEVSARMLSDLESRYVIIGHSERRSIFEEDSKTILKKIKSIHRESMIAILCIGESKKEKEENATFNAIESQLSKILNKLNASALKKLIIAYEPIWAIESDLKVNIEYIRKSILYIRSIILKINYNASKKIKIIYGGNVNKDNSGDILRYCFCDGLLIGRKSIKFKDLLYICKDIYKN